MLADGQVQLRNLVMGASTTYQFQTHFNPFTRNVRADQSAARAWNHGSYSGAEWTEQVAIPMRIVVMTTDAASYLAAIQALQVAFAPSNDDLELRFAINGVEYVMYGRPRMVDPEARRIGSTTYVQAVFVALDPSIYSGVQHTVQFGLPSTTGGMVTPVLAPFTVDGVTTAGRTTITNAGTKPTPLQLRIDATVTQPWVQLDTPAGSASVLTFFDLTTSQWIDIDTSKRTVYLNGNVSRRGYAAVTGAGWPILSPGSWDITFNAPVYDPASLLTVTWRDAWY